MKKRDIVTEIIGKRSRLSKRSEPYEHARTRIEGLGFSTIYLKPLSKEHKKIKQELIRYIAVGCVSCLEGYYRAIVKELIDYGSPFCDRAPELQIQNLDIRTLIKSNDKKVSIGEIISHLLNISSFNDIHKHMSTLLECDYFSKLKPMKILMNKRYGTFHPTARVILDDTFADRHIACHELNPRQKWTWNRAIDQWRVTIHTIEANEELLGEYGLR